MIDLHVNFEGSLPTETAYYLGKKYNLPLGDNFPSSILLKGEDGRDEYYSKLKFMNSFLQNPEGLELAAYSLVKKLDSLGYIYAEIRVVPLDHTDLGLTQRQIFNCILRGIYQGLDEFTDINVKVIFCMKRSSTLALNKHTIELALEYKNDVVVGVDLVGSALDRGIEPFMPLFEMAKEGGLHIACQPSVDELGFAIAHNFERITLPCPILVNNDLMLALQSHHFVFELIPSHLLYRNVISNISEVTSKNMICYGIPHTFTSGNLILCNSCVDNEYKKIIKECAYGYSDVRGNFNDAVMHSFASQEEKGILIRKVSTRFDYFFKDITEE